MFLWEAMNRLEDYTDVMLGWYKTSDDLYDSRNYFWTGHVHDYKQGDSMTRHYYGDLRVASEREVIYKGKPYWKIWLEQPQSIEDLYLKKDRIRKANEHISKKFKVTLEKLAEEKKQ